MIQLTNCQVRNGNICEFDSQILKLRQQFTNIQTPEYLKIHLVQKTSVAGHFHEYLYESTPLLTLKKGILGMLSCHFILASAADCMECE